MLLFGSMGLPLKEALHLKRETPFHSQWASSNTVLLQVRETQDFFLDWASFPLTCVLVFIDKTNKNLEFLRGLQRFLLKKSESMFDWLNLTKQTSSRPSRSHCFAHSNFYELFGGFGRLSLMETPEDLRNKPTIMIILAEIERQTRTKQIKRHQMASKASEGSLNTRPWGGLLLHLWTDHDENYLGPSESIMQTVIILESVSIFSLVHRYLRRMEGCSWRKINSKGIEKTMFLQIRGFNQVKTKLTQSLVAQHCARA